MSRRIDRKATSFPGVQRVGKGVYRIRGKYIHPKTDRRCELDRIVEAPGPREAASKRAELLAELARDPTPRTPTLKAFATAWYDSALPKLKPSTADFYSDVLDKRIVPSFGDWLIDRISMQDVANWRDAMAAKYAAHTVNGWLRVLRTILKLASRQLGMPHSPADGVAILPTKKTERVLTAKELRDLLDAARRKTPKWYPLILTLAHTGMRFGEASALEWRDIDWEAGSIRVERSHVRGKVGTTKTNTIRVVPLTAELREVLTRHRVETEGFDLVFPARLRGGDTKADAANAGYSQPSALSKPLQAARKEAKITRAVSPHWFRHTFSDLLRQTADREVKKALTSHETEEMEELYSNISLGEKQTAVARVLELVKRGGE